MMVIDDDGEPVEHDLGGTVGDVVAIAVGDEQQPRRTQQPDAAESELDAGEHLHVVGEHGATVEPAVGVGVLEDQHAIAMTEVEPIGCVGIGVVLGDPEPTAPVPGHRDRVLHVGLGREGRDAEPRRSPEAGRGLGWRRAPASLMVPCCEESGNRRPQSIE